MSYPRRVAFSLLLMAVLFCGGCLSKPYLPGKDLGTLHLRIQRAETPAGQEQSSMMALNKPINKIAIVLTKKTVMTKTVEPYVEGKVITVDSIYPGTWQIEVNAMTQKTDGSFTGLRPRRFSRRERKSGDNYPLAPGELNVTMDVTPLSAAGYDASRGRLYVYEDPQTDKATIFDLTLEGNLLKHREQILLPQGTYNARIYIPNKSNYFYESDYIQFHVLSGQVETVNLNADASIIIEGLIDLPPATPENFKVTLDNGQPLLRWDPVGDPDLAGYNVYRTNRDGRFVFLDQVDIATHFYHDTKVKIEDYEDNLLGYAVSSYDLRGNNSIWTAALYWPF